MEDDLNFWMKIEDDLNFSGNGRRPQFQDMEDHLKYSRMGRGPQFFRKRENDLEFSGNGRRLKFLNSISTDTKYISDISSGYWQF